MQNITEIGKFRLAPIVKLSGLHPVKLDEQSVGYGLALEAKTGENNYYTIAFIEWNAHECETKMRTVGERFIKEVDSADDWRAARALIKVAIELVTANAPKEDY